MPNYSNYSTNYSPSISNDSPPSTLFLGQNSTLFIYANRNKQEICCWIQNFENDRNVKLESTSTELENSTSILKSAALNEEYFWQNLDYLQEMFSQFLNGYLTFFAVFSGILLNALCIYVFLKYQRSGSPVIQYYLVTLTCWQTALLCNAFFLYCLPTLLYGHVVTNGNYVYFYPYAYAFANTTHTGSVWIILTLTIDRYLALCQPLKHRAIGKRSRVKRLMIGVSIFAILFSLPRFFEVTTVYYCANETESSGCAPTVARTALPEDKTYWTVYHIILAMLFVTLVPCLILLALTLRISMAIRNSVVRRKTLCAPQTDLIIDPMIKNDKKANQVCTKKEHKANVMLVLVIAKFLISDIFPTVADVLEHIIGNNIFMSSSLATLFVDFSNFLVVLNCSTNFWVFLIWGKRFRRSCYYMFADSCLGRTYNKWKKLKWDSDFGSYLGRHSSINTNLTKSRSRYSGYFSGDISIQKRSLLGADSSFAAGSPLFLISPRSSINNNSLNDPCNNFPIPPLRIHRASCTNVDDSHRIQTQKVYLGGQQHLTPKATFPQRPLSSLSNTYGGISTTCSTKPLPFSTTITPMANRALLNSYTRGQRASSMHAEMQSSVNELADQRPKT